MVKKLTGKQKGEKITEITNKVADELGINFNPFNIFHMLNMREDSHTEFLVWLLNTDCVFKKDFLSKFFGEDISINSKEMQVVSQYGFEETGVKSSIDILVYSDDFIGVIENKLDGDISISRKDRTTQLERYYKYMCSDKTINIGNKCINLSSITNKKFIFLCPNEEILEKKKKSKYKNVKINNGLCNEFNSAIKIIEKVENYKIVDYSVIIKILFKNKKNNTQNETKNQEKKHNLINYILKDKEKITEINNYYNNINSIPQECESFSYKIDFSEILKNLKEEEKNILIQDYIEYWEHWNKFNDGYSKLVEYNNQPEFLWDICKKEYIDAKYNMGNVDIVKIKNQVKLL